MIRVLLLDDEPPALRVLEHLLSGLPDIEVVAAVNDPVEAVQLLRAEGVDLLISDVEMPRLSGIDLMRAVADPPPVIFTTAHREYAPEGFEVDAIDYLLKPVALPRLLQALERFRQRTEAASPAAPPLSIPIGRRVVRIEASMVRYIESLDERVVVHARGESIETRVRISDWEQRLGDPFLRIHRSFLVPVDRIASYTAQDITLDTGEELPIGRSYQQAVRERLGRR